MRIVIDLQGAQASNRFRGIGRYSLSLALAIARLRGDHEVILALNGLFPETIEPIRAEFDGVLPQDNIRVWQAPGPLAYLDPTNIERRRAAELLREAFLASLAPDLVCVMSVFEGFADNAVASIGRFSGKFQTAVVSYDLIPYIHPDYYFADSKFREWYDEKLDYLRRASLLLAISESSKQEAIDHLAIPPERIVTALAAADSQFRPISLDVAARADLFGRYGISRRFVMYTGGDDPRKNMEGLIRAYARLPTAVRRSHQLAIVCCLEPARQRSLLAMAAELGLSPDEIVLTGQISDDDLVKLYNTCTLFVFPSRHEGFGLPALEAMSCGAPVIGSNTTSVPEVLGRQDALFDPNSDASMATKLLQVLTDDGFRADLSRHGLERAKSFSWDKSARSAIIALEGAHKSRQMPSRPLNRKLDRLRLAYVSPFPPDHSGIADYSAELVPELSRHYDIQAITSVARARGTSSQANITLRTPDWLRANARHFDRILYHFGNSSFHDYMFDLIEDVPGVVVLHDFFLGGVLFHRQHTEKRSHVWTRALYESHCYAAVREAGHTKSIDDTVLKYPANLEVLQKAQGIIVHSEFSQRLASQWYSGPVGRDWAVVPHLRAIPRHSDRIRARAALGIAPDAFLTCCFGIIGPTKLNHRALAAWLRSSLAHDNNCHLVFVGETFAGSYSRQIDTAIQQSGAAERIKITGWAKPDLYRQYLAAADIALQLRAQSRGESSRTALDCMAHGLPTIVTACGALAELPPDAVCMLPENFDDAALAAVLDEFRQDPGRRTALGARARELIRTQHDPRACADAYADEIERFHERSQTGVPALIDAIAAQVHVANNSECERIASAIARNHPALRPARRLFVDVSELVRHDVGSGIQRVVRNVLRTIYLAPPEGFRIEPVYATVESDGYRYARQFTLGFANCPAEWAADDPVDPQIGDIFLGLDLNQHVTTAHAKTLAGYRASGMRVYQVIYDILPVLRPEFFAVETHHLHTRWLTAVVQFDGVIAISRAVADELQGWLAQHGADRLRPLEIAWWHLGADIEVPAAARGLPSDVEQTIETIRSAPSFLIVGTIEPRKGHAQALSAFERLWSTGIDVRLVLVGKRGWMVKDLLDRIQHHIELGKRLIWLENISDEYLEQIYAASTCLLASSEAEGFGLPLIEAARHKLPIIARDIPVFREIAGGHTTYFDGRDPDTLAATIRDWLALFRKGGHPRSDAMPWSTWEQSTRALLDIVVHNRWQTTWAGRQDTTAS